MWDDGRPLSVLTVWQLCTWFTMTSDLFEEDSFSFGMREPIETFVHARGVRPLLSFVPHSSLGQFVSHPGNALVDYYEYSGFRVDRTKPVYEWKHWTDFHDKIVEQADVNQTVAEELGSVVDMPTYTTGCWGFAWMGRVVFEYFFTCDAVNECRDFTVVYSAVFSIVAYIAIRTLGPVESFEDNAKALLRVYYRDVCFPARGRPNARLEFWPWVVSVVFGGVFVSVMLCILSAVSLVWIIRSKLSSAHRYSNRFLDACNEMIGSFLGCVLVFNFVGIVLVMTVCCIIWTRFHSTCRYMHRYIRRCAVLAGCFVSIFGDLCKMRVGEYIGMDLEYLQPCIFRTYVRIFDELVPVIRFVLMGFYCNMFMVTVDRYYFYVLLLGYARPYDRYVYMTRDYIDVTRELKSWPIQLSFIPSTRGDEEVSTLRGWYLAGGFALVLSRRAYGLGETRELSALEYYSNVLKYDLVVLRALLDQRENTPRLT